MGTMDMPRWRPAALVGGVRATPPGHQPAMSLHGMLIFFRRRIGDVIENHHQIRTRGRDINAAVGERARLRDVQVGDLSDENGARGLLRSPADRRYATA